VNIKRIRAEIAGRVQGVGFRPTVCRYARALALAGFVKNTPDGVLLEIQGTPDAVDAFVERLQSGPPRQARMDSIRTEILPPGEDTGRFDILSSARSGDLRAGLPPDLATCEECRAELFDPANRRHRYPFINCVNCGPRFTIIRELPYDRKRTSMASFALCPECREEYLDPADRRFDAQPNACPVCGPRVRLISIQSKHPLVHHSPDKSDSRGDGGTSNTSTPERFCEARLQQGGEEEGKRFCEARLQPEAAIQEAVRLLKTGGILAVKGLGGYHLACDATSDAAVAQLRARKRRPDKSLAVMFASLDEIRRQTAVNEAEADLLTGCAAPIVIVRRKTGSTLSPLISPDTDDIGVFLPYSPLHQLLLVGISPLVMTSGNAAEEPIAMDEKQLKRILGTIADAALTHNRPILRRCDDSVIKVVQGQETVETHFKERPRWSVALHNQTENQMEGRAPSRPILVSPPLRQLLFRRSRGLVPDSIRLPLAGPPVLACGADLKNTICMTRGDEAFLSQHIGDLEELRAFHFFRETIADLTDLLKVRPAVIAHDLHPDYHSTRFALSPDAGDGKRMAVQHHHAHIAACMAEHGLADPVIGVALDGTGYGPDGTIWGGEFLVADLRSYRRAGHFKQYGMLGGEEAIRHPERMAFSMLLAEGLADASDLLPALDANQRKMLAAILEQTLNSPLTSSAGRLFDAVAALLGVGDSISYEARGAIRLQTLADRKISGHYPFEIIIGSESPIRREGTPVPINGDPTPSSGCLILSFGPMIHALVADLRVGADRSLMAGKFHNTIAEGVVEMCRRIRTLESLGKVALSGGVFQNDLLLEKITQGLIRKGFEVYSPQAVPPNDGGIALGQAVVAMGKR